MVDELSLGTPEKYVLTRHGQMCAVVLSIDDYAQLVQRANTTITIGAVA
jgi:hypothetical protein